jgi:hypothetical protein
VKEEKGVEEGEQIVESSRSTYRKLRLTPEERVINNISKNEVIRLLSAV